MVKIQKKRVLSFVAGLVMAVSVGTAANAYFHDSPALRNKAVDTGDGVNYTVPVSNVSDFFGKDFSARDFKDFTTRNFGSSVDKDFTAVPPSAVIMYQLKTIIDALDAKK